MAATLRPAPREGLRRALLAAAVLLSADLGGILITGSRSLLAAGGEVALAGFALRLAAWAALVVLRFHVLARERPPGHGGRLVLVLLLCPTLLQFQVLGARLAGVDALSYYVFLVSMAKDRNFELSNEYGHYGMLSRPDLSVPTRTGHRRTIYSVGPAVVWMPFFAVGEGAARLEQALGGKPADLSGHGPHHRNAVALGSLLYGFGALLFIHDLLRRHFAPGLALAAVLLIWGATFFHYYLVVHPTYAHNASTLGAAYALWLWDRGRGQRGFADWGYLGLVLGVSMCVRWQNGVLLLLPGLELLGWLLARLRAGSPPVSRETAAPFLAGLLLVTGTVVGAFPQMACWKAIYDMWVLPYPPQGTDFMRFDHPWVLETLFSSRHGLLSWTPVFWLGYLGLVPLVRRRPALGWPLVPLVLAMSYVNFCVGDYWGGASFSNRRFDSCLPLFACAFAAALEVLQAWIARHAQAALALALAPFLAWNLALSAAERQGRLPLDQPTSLATRVTAAAEAWDDAVGFPTTWPASWIFALRHQRPPSQYEALAGRYLFYRQNSLGRVWDLGQPGDERLLGNGWGAPEMYLGVSARRLRERAFVFAPLDVPEDMAVAPRTAAPAGPVGVRLRVNGTEAARWTAGPAWNAERFTVPRTAWRRELNEVWLESEGGEVLLDRIEFERVKK